MASLNDASMDLNPEKTTYQFSDILHAQFIDEHGQVYANEDIVDTYNENAVQARISSSDSTTAHQHDMPPTYVMVPQHQVAHQYVPTQPMPQQQVLHQHQEQHGQNVNSVVMNDGILPLMAPPMPQQHILNQQQPTQSAMQQNVSDVPAVDENGNPSIVPYPGIHGFQVSAPRIF